MGQNAYGHYKSFPMNAHCQYLIQRDETLLARFGCRDAFPTR